MDGCVFLPLLQLFVLFSLQNKYLHRECGNEGGGHLVSELKSTAAAPGTGTGTGAS